MALRSLPEPESQTPIGRHCRYFNGEISVILRGKDIPRALRLAENEEDVLKILAGAAGSEPANHGIKTRCLTTWLRPKQQFLRNLILTLHG